MNYELAKELKDAGFPQKSMTIGFPEEYGPGGVYLPSLEELIEACGDGIVAVQKDGPGKWDAVDEWEEYYPPEVKKGASGSTPTEAAARLWLALNKKS
jgi:hypothetical protein